MDDKSDILRLLWSRRTGIEGVGLRSVDGQDIIVSGCGDPGPDGKLFRGAEVLVDGVVHRGDVVFGNLRGNPSPYAVLHVTDTPSDSLLTADGARIPQVVLDIPGETLRSVKSLKEGAGRFECGAWLADIPSAVRVSIMDDLLVERLRRKYGDIMKVFGDSGDNWGQTMYVMLFRTMGGNRNREPYMKLASLADYSMVMREKSSLKMIEALLLGTSGLLEGVYFDDYILELRDHFGYLRSKYRIIPMRADEWERGRMNPRNNPVLRIVQLASFLAGRDFVFDSVMGCRSRGDVHCLFSAEASEYWTTHYIPDGRSGRCPKTIGEDKADLFGINLVAPMMFAYGDYTGKEELKEAAVELLSRIPCESNSIIRGWSGMGVSALNALDSQALIQLSNEYCAHARCTECRIGRRIIKSAGKSFTFQ